MPITSSGIVPPVKQIDHWLAYIRFNLADGSIFDLVSSALLPLAPSMSADQAENLDLLIQESWQKFYYFPGEKNAPFYFSEIYFAMGRHEQSLFYLNETVRYFGSNAFLSYLKAICHERLGRTDEAIALCEEALLLNPELTDARNALNAMQEKVKLIPPTA